MGARTFRVADPEGFKLVFSTQREQWRRSDDQTVQAEVRIDDTVIMLADPAPPDWPAIASSVHVYVRDVDATYRSALDAGAVSVQEPVKKEDEDKRGGVKDAGGTTWWIATRMA